MVLVLVLVEATPDAKPCSSLTLEEKKQKIHERYEARIQKRHDFENHNVTTLQAHLSDNYVVAMVNEEALIKIVEAQLLEQLPPVVMREAGYEIFDFDFKINIFTPTKIPNRVIQESLTSEFEGGTFRVSHIVSETSFWSEIGLDNPLVVYSMLVWLVLAHVILFRLVYLSYKTKSNGSFSETEEYFVVWFGKKLWNEK
ncbi:MAG: hypothetical protein ACTSUE_05045 [Promethearchaeota archaeon]